MSRVARAEALEQANARPEAKKRRKKKKSSKGLWVFVLILAVIVAVGGWYTIQLGPVDRTNTEEVVVAIPQGSGASYIVDVLTRPVL